MENNPKLKQAFGVVLLQLREEKNVSQKEVADNCDMERAYVSRLERGLLQPTLTSIFKLAEYFDILPEELVNKVHTAYKKKK